jgi:hypothetical protein
MIFFPPFFLSIPHLRKFFLYSVGDPSGLSEGGLRFGDRQDTNEFFLWAKQGKTL